MQLADSFFSVVRGEFSEFSFFFVARGEFSRVGHERASHSVEPNRGTGRDGTRRGCACGSLYIDASSTRYQASSLNKCLSLGATIVCFGFREKSTLAACEYSPLYGGLF